MSTQTRVPNSDITYTNISLNGGSYLYSVENDDLDSTFAYDTMSGTGAEGRCGFSAFDFSDSAMVNSITVTLRASAAGDEYTCYITPYIKVDGVIYYHASAITLTAVAASYDRSWTTNPDTSSAWTVADAKGTGSDALESFGFSFQSVYGMYTTVYEMKITVDYTLTNTYNKSVTITATAALGDEETAGFAASGAIAATGALSVQSELIHNYYATVTVGATADIDTAEVLGNFYDASVTLVATGAVGTESDVTRAGKPYAVGAGPATMQDVRIVNTG